MAAMHRSPSFADNAISQQRSAGSLSRSTSMAKDVSPPAYEAAPLTEEDVRQHLSNSERPRFVAERLATYLQAAHPAFFSRLQRAVLVQLCAAGMTQVVAEPGEVICKHGSAVSGVHVLLSGSASVWLPSGGELTRSNTLRSSLLAASGTPRSPSCGSYGPGSATSTPKPGGSGGGGSTSSSRAGATSSAANSPKPGAVPHWFPLQGGGSSQTAPPPPRIPSPRAHGNSPLGGASDVTATVTHFSFHDAAAGATASAKASPPPAPSSSSSSSAPADAAAARGLNPLSVSTTARDDSPNGGGGGELGLPSPSPRISFNLGRGLGGLKIPTNVGTGSAGADTSRAATPAGPVPPSPTLSPSPAAPGSARGRSGWGKAKGLQAALALSRSMSRMGGPRRAAAAAVQALAADGNYGEMRSADGEDAGELNVALADVLAGRPGLADSLGRLAAYLSAPGWWGELAVVAPGTKHAASVVAVSPCWVLELPVGVLSGANLPPLTAAVAEDGDGGGAAAAGPATTAYTRGHLVGVARKVPSSRSRADCLFLVRDFLAPLPQLTSCSREVLLELAREVTLAEYEAGQVMLAQGDVSRAVMVIMTGAADAYRTVAIPLLTATGPERGSEGGGGASGGPAVPPLEVGVSQIMSESSLTLMQQPSYIGALVEQYGKWQASYGPGAMLGDLDAMGPTAGGGGGGGGGRGGSSSNARPANLSTVVAIRPVVALVISNDVYNRTVRLMRSTELKQRLTLLKMMPVLASSHRSAVINAANAVVPVEVPRGAALQREGDKFKGIHFIMSGMATVLLGQAAASGAGAAGGVVAAGESPTWRPQGGGHIGGDGAAGPRIMVREVGVLGELDCFGEDGMLTNVHSVCVVAATPCKLLLLKATDVIILGERGIRSLHAVAQMKEEWRARRLESAAVAGQAVAVPRWRTRGVGRPGPPQAQLFSAVPPAAQRLARATADALPWAGNRGLKAAQPGMDERTGDSIADSSVPLSKASWTLHPEGRSEAEASEGMSTTFEPAGAFKRNMMFFKAWAGAIGQDAALSSLLQVEQESAEASHRAAAVLADRSMRAIPGSVQLASAYEDITTHANVAAIESFNASRRSTQFAGLKWEARADSAVSTSSASGLQPPADASSGAASGAAAAETIAAAAPAELYVSTSDVLGRRREARRTVGDLPQTPYKLRASNAFVLSELFPGEAVTVGVSEPRHAPRGTQHQQPAGKR